MKMEDEIEIELVSALGSSYGKMLMPKKIEGWLIKAYLESGTVKSASLFIDDKEITDGVNYNQYYHL